MCSEENSSDRLHAFYNVASRAEGSVMVLAHTTLSAMACAGIHTLDPLRVSFNYCKLILTLESMINSNPTTSEDGKVNAVCPIYVLGASTLYTFPL